VSFSVDKVLLLAFLSREDAAAHHDEPALTASVRMLLFLFGLLFS
jgi:hypothetical protein